MSHIEQHCPICQQSVKPSARYSHYICGDCSELACDAQGQTVYFYNGAEMVDDTRDGKSVFVVTEVGLEAKYTHSKQPYHQQYFWIREHKCIAREAYMGGVVYLLADDPIYGN